MSDLKDYLRRAPKPRLAKKLNIVAWLLTVVVLGLVGLMRRPEFKIATDMDLSWLPGFHAMVNVFTAIVLVMALYFIKTGQPDKHRKMIYAAFGLSVLFLGSYVAYHFTHTETIYGDADGNGILSAAEELEIGGARTVYLVLLVSHIITAAVNFPFILFTFIRAYTNQFVKHRKMARWVFPVWLYVAVTGPICFMMLWPYYQ